MNKQGEWDWAKKSEWASESTAVTSSKHEATAAVWSVWSQPFVDWVSKQNGRVAGVWALGSVLAIHLEDSEGAGYSSNVAVDLQSALLKGDFGSEGERWNVHSRVLGNVLYVMTSQTTKQEDVERLQKLLRQALM